MQGPSQQLCVLVPTEHRDSGRQGGTHLGLPPEAWLGGGGASGLLADRRGKGEGSMRKEGPFRKAEKGSKGRKTVWKKNSHSLFICLYFSK